MIIEQVSNECVVEQVSNEYVVGGTKNEIKGVLGYNLDNTLAGVLPELVMILFPNALCVN